MILILDFGSQYTQLIARRVREAQVYCEIIPCHFSFAEIRKRKPAGLILSGGPASVYDADAPLCDSSILSLDVPILGICYGMQWMTHRLGGRVARSEKREYGHAQIVLSGSQEPLLHGVLNKQVWMSHGDRVESVPKGFKVLAKTEHSPIAAMVDLRRRFWGLQFHPEVVHTPEGSKILSNFVHAICECSPTWTMGSLIKQISEAIAQQAGKSRAIAALSGGVDSTVAAVLTHRVIGRRLTCVFVDNGLLRKNEAQQVMQTLKAELNLPLCRVNASNVFLQALASTTSPERKRKIIGRTFIAVFEEYAKKLGKIDYLVQGTLYPDVIESQTIRGPSATIKTHHNVGGLPKKMRFSLIEPLRMLFKDEVRALGAQLGLPERLLHRHPFPGPGLAIRILGKVTPERLHRLREADAIFDEEIRKAGLYASLWQSFAVDLPVQTVGVMGDGRTYEHVIALRAVTSKDAMTAEAAPIPHEVLKGVAHRIINEVPGINRVVYDISSKPPSTIEWE